MTGQSRCTEVLETIDDIGYNGFVTVELYTYEHAAEAAALEAFRYLPGLEVLRREVSPP